MGCLMNAVCFDQLMYIGALLIVCVACLGAIWCDAFKDNLFQRVGCALGFLGAMARLSAEVVIDDSPTSRYLFVYGVALYAIGTVQKFYKHNPRKVKTWN